MGCFFCFCLLVSWGFVVIIENVQFAVEADAFLPERPKIAHADGWKNVDVPPVLAYK